MSETPSGWAIGWTYFAAFMLMIGAVFQSVIGLTAILHGDFYVTVDDYLVSVDASIWGWVHLAVGAALLLVGIGILRGNLVARVAGVIAAGLSAVANFAFLPYYPVWALTVIAVDVAIIWALTAHGRDVTVLARAAPPG